MLRLVYNWIRDRIGARELATLVVVVSAALVPVVSMWGADPLLRHDWTWYPFSADANAILSRAFSGWHSEGMGSPCAIVNVYLVVTVLYPLLAWLPHFAVVAVVIFASALGAAYGAYRLAILANAGRSAACANALVAVGNPWFYTELVAGHGFMLLAYAAVILLAGYWLSAGRRSATMRAILVCVTFAQLQFFLIAIVIETLYALRKKSWQPLLIASIVALPVAIGVVLDTRGLADVPYLLAWERVQSVQPLQALILSGYSVDYARVFATFFPTVALGFCVVLATVGAVLGIARRESRLTTSVVVVGGILCACVSMGTVGPLSSPYKWLVLHVQASGVFRELYDLVGCVAISYLVLIPIALARVPWLRIVWLCCGGVLVMCWALYPPFHWWVNANALPRVAITAEPNSRFALFPAFQPMSYGGRGSGVDPDAVPLWDNVTPLNEYLVTYPGVAAFARYEKTGQVDWLSALSVSDIVYRPWFSVRWDALKGQTSLPVGYVTEQPPEAKEKRISAAPELATAALPSPALQPVLLGRGDALFCDLRMLRGARVPIGWKRFPACERIAASREEVDASKGWVDARLGFLAHPDLSQPFGGAMTTSPSAALGVDGDSDYLVWINGALHAAPNNVTIRGKGGYKWIHLKVGASRVTCSGLCVLALKSHLTDVVPRHTLTRASRVTRIKFRAIAPWLVTAEVARTDEPVLRYNVAYDRGWLAVENGHSLAHFRVDGIVNGWILQPLGRDQRIVIIHVPSALQALTAFLALGFIFTIATRRAYGVLSSLP